LSARALLAVLLALPASGCIAPSVVDAGERAVRLDAADTVWLPADAADLPGTYVSAELSGPLAASLRKLVYRFGADGSYSGAGLLDGAPPHFEVITGRWAWTEAGLSLDGGPPAAVEVAGDGSLRLVGSDGRVVLRRELDR